MGTLTAPEIRECRLSPKDRAIARDNVVREWIATVQNWRVIARACVEVKNDKDFETLGFPSFDAWLVDVAPEEKSRSYLHLICNQYLALAKMIPDEQEADGIKLGSVSVLKQLSPAVRNNPRVLEAARRRPERLREVLEQEFPDQHVETMVNKKISFTKSQWAVVEAKFDAYRLTDENGSLADFIESLCAEPV